MIGSTSRFFRIVFALFVFLLSAGDGFGSLRRYFTGNPADAVTGACGPAWQLDAGGGDVDRAWRWTIDQVRGCSRCDARVDVVILRGSGSNGYNDYLMAMEGVDSVESLVITDRQSAHDPEVLRSVRNAEVVFFAGGDQCRYVKNINGTELEQAVRSVSARGGAVGGTSAGLAIQGEIVYDACSSEDGARSVSALREPYMSDVSLTYDFFDWPFLEDLITDSHFAQRNRMGRVLVFIARALRERDGNEIYGLGLSEGTSVVIDANGVGLVIGRGPVYLILGDHFPEEWDPDTPLTYCGFRVWRFQSGDTFSLRDRMQRGGYRVDVVDGKVQALSY